MEREGVSSELPAWPGHRVPRASAQPIARRQGGWLRPQEKRGGPESPLHATLRRLAAMNRLAKARATPHRGSQMGGFRLRHAVPRSGPVGSTISSQGQQGPEAHDGQGQALEGTPQLTWRCPQPRPTQGPRFPTVQLASAVPTAGLGGNLTQAIANQHTERRRTRGGLRQDQEPEQTGTFRKARGGPGGRGDGDTRDKVCFCTSKKRRFRHQASTPCSGQQVKSHQP